MALRQQAMNQRLIASRERVRKLRRLKGQKERQARVRALLNRIGNERRKEIFRGVRRQVRGHLRKRIRQILPFYY